MIKKIARTIFKQSNSLNSFYHRLSEYKKILNELKPLHLKYKKNKNLVFIIFTPEYSNLGDHAIASAEIKLLDSLNIEYIEISNFLLYRIHKHNLLRFFNKKTLLIQGGGFLGSLWINDDIIIRKLVKSSPKSKIYFFPSTIHYESTDFGRKEFENSKRIYNAHNNLTLCARESISYEMMKSAYKNVRLIPDMVLYLNESVSDTTRNGCLICLRNDLEKTLTEEEKDSVKNSATELFGENIGFTDMCLDCNIPSKDRDLRLEEKFKQFRKAELVITDRLHGMIFCAITGTPCIVLNSKSPKVKGCYKWIDNSEYIKFADNISEICNIYKTIPKKDFTYDNSHLEQYFDILKSDILNLLN